MIFYGKIEGFSFEKHEKDIGYNGRTGSMNYVYALVEMPLDGMTIEKKFRIDNFFHGWFNWERITDKRIGVIKKTSDEFVGKYFLFSEKEGELKSGMFTQELHHAAQKNVSGL